MATRLALSLLRTPVLPVSLLLFTAHTLSHPLRADAAPPLPKAHKRPALSRDELFPPSLIHPSGATLTLLGRGIRTVTFMRIKVYEVGVYADVQAMAPALEPGELGAGERMERLLARGDCMLRIVPTRRTNYTHLRDGFIKALQHRVSLLPAPPSQNTQLALGHVMTLFPNTPMTPEQTMDIAYFHPGATTTQQGSKQWTSEDGSNVAQWSWKSSRTEGWPEAWLWVGVDGKEMGTVRDGWVAREWVLAYFDEKREISRELRETVGKKLNELAKEQPVQASGKPVKLNWV